MVYFICEKRGRNADKWRRDGDRLPCGIREVQGHGKRIVALEKQAEQPVEVIQLSQRKQFGLSSEEPGEEGDEQLSLLFNEAEAHCAVSEKKEMTTVAGLFLLSGMVHLPGHFRSTM